MTPEERARDIAERLVRFDAIPSRAAVNYVAGELEAAIRAAIAEEREACARIAESGPHRDWDEVADHHAIAAVIRAREGD